MSVLTNFIHNYPLSKFLALSGSEQLTALKTEFPKRKKESLKVSKSRFFKKLTQQNSKQALKIYNPKTPSTPPKNPDDGSSAPGGVSDYIDQLDKIFTEWEKHDPIKLAKASIITKMSDNIRAAQYILENQSLFLPGHEESKPLWFRPKVLYPKQHQICDFLNDNETQIIVITGPRRTGKSTSWYVGVNEAIYDGLRTQWGLWGATERGASKILTDAWKDQLTSDATRPLHTAKTFSKLNFFNGGLIEVNATTVTGSKGFKYHGIIMTEFDQILKDNPDAVASIVGILRSEPNLKLMLDMNMGSGAYHLLMDKLSKEKYKGRVQIIELLNEDVQHLSVERDELVADIMECAMGQDYVDEQMKHIESFTGDSFPPKLIIEAMNSYDKFMLTVAKKKHLCVIGVDPGFGHPTGIFVLGAHRGHLFELESMELRGKDTSEDRIKALVAELAIDYGAEIVCESNSGGLHWIKEWNDKYNLRAISQNFSSNQLDYSARGSMIRIVRELLETHRIHFCNDRLRQEMLIYNPEKDKNDSKGDLADAFIHAVYRCKMEYLESEDDQVAYSI